MLMTGCVKREVEIKYVDRPVEVLVPVPCNLPKVSCVVDMNATYTEKVRGLGECVEELKQVTEMFK